MNIEQIKEMLKRVMKQNPELKPVIEAFDRFLELYAQRNELHKNEKQFQKNLENSYSRLWETFEAALAEKGWSVNSIQEYLTDPTNFPSGQWDQMEQMKEGFRNLRTPATKSASKRPKTNKNVRI